MINLGLHGPAGSGKNTVADYLSERYGFIQYAFADGLRDEVQAAFGLEDQLLLRDRGTKEVPADELALVNCADEAFVEVASAPGRIPETIRYLGAFNQPLSPRQITQWWGTEYRRARDEEYWVQRASDKLSRIFWSATFPEQRPQLFVCTDCRFPNEQAFFHRFACGNIWHLHRDAATPVNAHASETPLPVLDGEREIWNNGDIGHLHQGVDLLLRTSAQFVRCEPLVRISGTCTSEEFEQYGRKFIRPEQEPVMSAPPRSSCGASRCGPMNRSQFEKE
ncbi:MAG: hypothetical protein Q8P61_04485 [Candidatus Nanopelagicales bacterium]|nr:hypothetical protein [Candidatus Nanopelagicales bacterium]